MVFGTELLQFAAAVAVFAVAALLWLLIVFVPGRTVEHWDVFRAATRDESGGDEPAPGPRKIP